MERPGLRKNQGEALHYSGKTAGTASRRQDALVVSVSVPCCTPTIDTRGRMGLTDRRENGTCSIYKFEPLILCS